MNSRHPGRPRKEKYMEILLACPLLGLSCLNVDDINSNFENFYVTLSTSHDAEVGINKRKQERKKISSLPRFFLFFVSFFV